MWAYDICVQKAIKALFASFKKIWPRARCHACAVHQQVDPSTPGTQFRNKCLTILSQSDITSDDFCVSIVVEIAGFTIATSGRNDRVGLDQFPRDDTADSLIPLCDQRALPVGLREAVLHQSCPVSTQPSYRKAGLSCKHSTPGLGIFLLRGSEDIRKREARVSRWPLKSLSLAGRRGATSALRVSETNPGLLWRTRPRDKTRPTGDKPCDPDGSEKSSRSRSDLLEHAGRPRSENSAETPYPEHHADGRPANLRIVPSRAEVVQSALPAQDAESRASHAQDVE